MIKFTQSDQKPKGEDRYCTLRQLGLINGVKCQQIGLGN